MPVSSVTASLSTWGADVRGALRRMRISSLITVKNVALVSPPECHTASVQRFQRTKRHVKKIRGTQKTTEALIPGPLKVGCAATVAQLKVRKQIGHNNAGKRRARDIKEPPTHETLEEEGDNCESGRRWRKRATSVSGRRSLTLRCTGKVGGVPKCHRVRTAGSEIFFHIFIFFFLLRISLGSKM